MLWVKINTSLYNKFILDCYKRDITIYNTIKKNDYYILIKEDDYKKLKSIWYIKYQFVKYKGILYIKDILYRYRIIIGSSIMGIILLFILSNIIIKIDIMSNNSDLKYYIKEELKELGIKEGYFKKSYKEVEEILKKIKDNSNNRIEWIEIENIGMKYIVKVVERKEVNEEKKKDYCNIISNSDAIVKNIYYSKGESKIYIGQSVKENDVLISGDIIKDEKIVGNTCAEGKVYGEVFLNVDISIPLNYKEKIKTGKRRWNIVLKNNHYNDSIFRPRLDKYVYNDTYLFSIFSNELYFRVEESIKEIDKVYSEDEALVMANKKLEEELGKTFYEKEGIITKKVLKKSVNNSTINVVFFVSLLKQIGKVQELENRSGIDGNSY